MTIRLWLFAFGVVLAIMLAAYAAGKWVPV